MVQVDLITGFLGAGKTTFLRRYAAYLTAQGHHVCILENDFGAVNVDAMLLQDLIGEHCDIETISGGCDCDTHQRRMRTKLISMAMRGFDRVVVEPSGIFDVDEFFDILRDDPLFKYVKNGEYVYYVHSYYAKNCAASTLATSDYSIPVTGAVRQGLVYGTQFHPEKSGDTGLRILKAFSEL